MSLPQMNPPTFHASQVGSQDRIDAGHGNDKTDLSQAIIDDLWKLLDYLGTNEKRVFNRFVNPWLKL